MWNNVPLLTIRNLVPLTQGRSTVPPSNESPRRARADARKNADALLAAARTVFAASGVDAPAREIASAAGVGIGTLYRHFPNRADLVVGVFTTEIDATAAAADELLRALPPGEALDRWIERFTRFVATKQGLSAALRSCDPAFDALPAYLTGKLGPALGTLLDAAAAAGEIRADVDPLDLLLAMGDLSHRAPSTDGSPNPMVRLLLDGLRARPASAPRAPGRTGSRPSASAPPSIRYEWRGTVTDDEVNALHAEAFEHGPSDDRWNDHLHRLSLGWVAARDDDGLVGFVNVVWDGLAHAFVLDTAVAGRARRRGIGVGLIEVAREHAAAAGCEWLHVDFEDHLRGFYLDACGFSPTDAGLIRLR